MGQHGLRQDDRGYAAVIAVSLLALCTLIGISALRISVTETDITKNEIIANQNFYQAEAGALIATVPLITTEAGGIWANDAFLDGSNNAVQVVDGNFLQEARDSDDDKKWNNFTKARLAKKNVVKKNKYMPIDDPFLKKADREDPEIDSSGIATEPDLRIQQLGKFNLEVDVDKVDVGFLTGGGVEFGARSDSTGNQGIKIIYTLNCTAVPPASLMRDGSNNINEANSLFELVVGFRYVLR